MKYVNMFNQGIRRVQEMLRENDNEEAEFDVSKLTVFVVNVFSTVDDSRDGTQGVTQDVPQGVTQDDTQRDTQGDTQDDTQGGTQDGTQDVPQDVPQGVPQDVPQDDSQGASLDDWIEAQIKKNPKITTEELGQISGFTSKTIKRHLAKLSHIKYVGSGYSGHWEITDNK